MIEIEAKRNKRSPYGSYRFENNDNEFDKVINICQRCQFLDQESDFPNAWCDKSNEMIDYWFCAAECPLKKWKLIEKDDTKGK